MKTHQRTSRTHEHSSIEKGQKRRKREKKKEGEEERERERDKEREREREDGIQRDMFGCHCLALRQPR